MFNELKKYTAKPYLIMWQWGIRYLHYLKKPLYLLKMIRSLLSGVWDVHCLQLT